MPSSRITKRHYETLAAIRHALRIFLNFSEDAARQAGLTPQQHQALLALKGFPGRDYASIAELAERLQIKHHSAVGLVDRLVKNRLIKRQAAAEDARRVELHLTPRGEEVIEALSSIHLKEFKQTGPALRALLDEASGAKGSGLNN